MSAYVDAARGWLAQDPDAVTRDELTALLERVEAGDAAAADDLADRFSTRLAFGTAGLRGTLGAGSNRMNRVLVAQAAAGFAAYLLERGASRPPASDAGAFGAGDGEDRDATGSQDPDATGSQDPDATGSQDPDATGSPDRDATGSPDRDATGSHPDDSPAVPGSDRDDRPVVVVGYDGRRNSDVFARDSVEIFTGAGLRAILLPRMLPTPVLAFAVRHLGADAGVMVTASHNPPDDNGYKVYLGGPDDGAQIVSPADAEIAAHIQRVADAGDVTTLPRSVGYENAPESLVEAYIAATAAVAPAPAGAEGLRWVYTAMHGVGWETVRRVLAEAGYPAPVLVTEQIEPDGRFPTVAFPNPEEPGAMDLAFRTARDAGAELVIANDPDADRLAVAIPDADAADGWRRLTGNEIGLLLGWRTARAVAATSAGASASLACSLVSSPGLQAVAEYYGLGFHATLTGFKWISRAPGIAFGFEEALGYLVNPDVVRDKDGISAAVALLGMATEARGQGRSVADLLQEFRETFGAFASDQISVRVSDVGEIAGIMAALRAQPPAAIGEVAVSRIDDLLDGVDGLPPGDVLRIWLEDGSRLIVRPSGTEPKLKLYLDVRGSSAKKAARRLAALHAGAEALLASLR